MDKANEIIKEDYGGSRPTIDGVLVSSFPTCDNYRYLQQMLAIIYNDKPEFKYVQFNSDLFKMYSRCVKEPRMI